jgi:hypothetical protein
MTKLALVFSLILCFGNRTTAQQEVPMPDAPRACDAKTFPIAKGGSKYCCQAGKDQFFVSPNGGVAHRTLGRSCSQEDGSTNCDGQCFYGPCGTHVKEVLEGHDTFIFRPKSRPQVCGYQTTTAEGKVIFFPERYEHQSLYPKVTPTCTNTACPRP